MTTMTFVERRQGVVATIARVILFWGIAAALVAAAHLKLDRDFPWGGAAVEVGALITVAFFYMRFIARQATVDHALLVGIIWLLLAIAGEITVAGYVHHDWFALLGSPARPMLRNVFLFAWVFAPSLFARSESVD